MPPAMQPPQPPQPSTLERQQRTPQQARHFEATVEYYVAVADCVVVAADGSSDMFWPLPQNFSFAVEHCKRAWGVELDQSTSEWISIAHDIPRFRYTTNIVFSSGDLDPWSSAGILQSPAPERSLISLNITGGAHHLDLMFANANDPPSVLQARSVELSMINRWIAAFNDKAMDC